MSQRCRETSGILFKRRCTHEATQSCSVCSKPMCLVHTRKLMEGEACIDCARTRVSSGSQSGSLVYLQDDPYFYWYHRRDHWYGSRYTDSDYEHFDQDWGGSVESGVEDQWVGT